MVVWQINLISIGADQQMMKKSTDAYMSPGSCELTNECSFSARTLWQVIIETESPSSLINTRPVVSKLTQRILQNKQFVRGETRLNFFVQNWQSLLVIWKVQRTDLIMN